MIRFCSISDTHARHASLDIEPCDLLLHSGDCLNSGSIKELPFFLYWLNEQSQAKEIVFIAGNHDYAFEGSRSRRSPPQYRGDSRESILRRVQEELDRYPRLNYLKDSFVELYDLKIYGSPWQPEFCNWAFNLPRKSWELMNVWSKIPEDTDILLTHGPPKLILDWCRDNGFRAGCELLWKRILEVKPTIHQFGHIHESFGTDQESLPGVTFINASCCTLKYRPIQGPVYGWIDPKTKEVILDEEI
jgi:predicted phosphodiesterase